MNTKHAQTNTNDNNLNESNLSADKAKSSGFWSSIVKLFVILIIIAAALGGYAYLQFKNFIQEPISQQLAPLALHIEAGSSAYKVANQLHREGYLAQPQWFVWYLRYLNKQHIIKAGEVLIQPSWNVDELIKALETSKHIQYPATIIAGQTIEQTLQAIQALPKIKKEVDITDIKQLQRLLGVAETKIDERYPYASVEGLLLPETYYYQLGDTDKDIILRAHAALNNTLDKAWEKRVEKLPYKDKYEALIMASIVEKETGYAPERPMIAGVFVRRMQKGMRLQTDPTVIYGIGKKYDGNIRKRDLQTKTPYNTYTINRLPPTPIALPSADAIQATLNPAETKALYFVAKGEGKHHFSNTLVEHNRAVRKYLLNK